MSRVFVINVPTKMDPHGNLEPSIDVEPAAEYGSLIHILPPGELIGTPDQTIARIHSALEDFSEDDHLLLCGDPRAIAWASAIAADRADGNLSLLRWIRSQHRYQAIRHPLWDPS